MSTIKRNVSEELIHAYVDQNLSPEENARFERLLENSPKLVEQVNAYRNQNEMMHRVFDTVLDEPVPDVLLKSPRMKKPNNYLFNLVASFLLLSVGGVVGWFINDNKIDNYRVVANLAETATRAHMVYAPEIKHPVEVVAEQEQHLVKWLSKRLGKPINAPDLNGQGFALVGGRLLPATTGPAAQFMYENAAGERLTIFLRTKSHSEKDIAFRFYAENNANAFYWIDGELAYAIVGNIKKSQLFDTANDVYQQLSL